MPDGQRLRILEERTSIHVSPATSGTTIMHTLEVEGGTRVRNASYILGPKDNLLWLVRTVVPGNPYIGETHFNPGKNDRLFLMKEYESRFQSLIYGIVVAAKARKFPSAPTVFNLHVAEFAQFNLAIYYTYFTHPASPDASFVSPFTSKPLLVDGAKPERHSEGTSPMTNEELLGKMTAYFGRLATKTATNTPFLMPPHMRQMAFDDAHLFSINPVKDFKELDRERARGLVAVFPSNDGSDGTFIRGAF